jgi:hypothetical protein
MVSLLSDNGTTLAPGFWRLERFGLGVNCRRGRTGGTVLEATARVSLLALVRAAGLAAQLPSPHVEPAADFE